MTMSPVAVLSSTSRTHGDCSCKRSSAVSAASKQAVPVHELLQSVDPAVQIAGSAPVRPQDVMHARLQQYQHEGQEAEAV